MLFISFVHDIDLLLRAYVSLRTTQEKQMFSQFNTFHPVQRSKSKNRFMPRQLPETVFGKMLSIAFMHGIRYVAKREGIIANHTGEADVPTYLILFAWSNAVNLKMNVCVVNALRQFYFMIDQHLHQQGVRWRQQFWSLLLRIRNLSKVLHTSHARVPCWRQPKHASFHFFRRFFFFL